MVSLLDGCSDGCGWTAAIIAVLSWGTFGVPLKVTTNVEVNFFVMQSYKTMVCFVTAWLVILLGEPVRFTPWGIVSGIFWVPGAACGIYGIRNAGVAIAVGTWSAIQVSTSFIFGIIIFQERVKDFQQTMMAFFVLMIGLVGMSIYSESSSKPKSSGEYHAVAMQEAHFPPSSPIKRSSVPVSERTDQISLASLSAPPSGNSFSNILPMELEDGRDSMEEPLMLDDKAMAKERIVLFNGRLALSRRQLGILGAVVNGVWGGMNLIPLHYAQRDQGLSGAGYLISYASGSMLVCICIWAALFGYHYIQRNYNLQEALDQLPSWHIKELGLPGMLAGIFYSIGNFCSILAVTYLGQGVGFSFCQGQLFISGLWGVFYFGEIQGRDTIAKWFASASLTIVGIIWLSYQHDGTPLHRFLISLLDPEDKLAGLL